MSSAGVPPSGASPITALVREWLTKADADLQVAIHLSKLTTGIQHDAVGFHAQQAIEKLMKAVLVARGVTPPKTHDLMELDRSFAAAGIGWSWSHTELRTLSTAAVHARYPGFAIQPQQAVDLLRIANAIWASLRPLV